MDYKTAMLEGSAARETIIWLGWADNDYIAARTLLLQHSIIQGCAFANTAIEKYLKTIFLIEGKSFPKTHNISDLYRKIVTTKKDLGVNTEFLDLLVKCYKMRYPDDLEVGYNIALVETKILAELDYSVFKIRKGFKFNNGNKPIKTKIDLLTDNKSDELLKNNCYFGITDRKELFEKDSFCYELRVLGENQIIEATYMTTGIDDDGKFNLEGLKPGK